MTNPLQSVVAPPLFHASRIDYSCAGEALIVADLLPTGGPGFLVDIGAGDGSSWSLSRGLIDDGWTGLLVEASAPRFQTLQQSLSSFPNAHCVNAFCGAGEQNNDAVSLAGILTRHSVPENFQLLILSSAEAAAGILAGFDPVRHKAALIVVRDQEAAHEARTGMYRLLIQYGYRYAGMAGAAYSMWSASTLETRSHPPVPPEALPPLTSAPSALVAYDVAPAALASCGTSDSQTYLISGWAFVESPRTVPPLVYLEVRDHRSGLTDYFEAYRCRRPDVSQHFGHPGLAMSGFRALITLRGHMAGAASIGVVQFDSHHRYSSSVELVIQRPLEDYEQNPRLGLARKYLRGTGIEIGALQKPLPLSDSCRVRFVDRMALAELLHHYPELRGIPVQAPDIIDNGEELSAIASRSQDFVVANHFLEHCQNPLQTLSNFLRVLRTGGVLFMAVPDKRFTFDFDRPCTEYETLRQAYSTGRRANRSELFHEWVRCAEHLSSHDADLRASQLDASDYSIHYNVWTVDSLLSQLLQARSEFAFPFRLLAVVCCDNEAIVLLENTGSQPDIPKTTMIENNLAISRISSSDSSQTNARYSTWKYVIPLPPDNLMWSVGAATIENFIVVGDAWAQVVSRYTQENTTLLDIGCGCGRSARLLVNNRWISHYIGFDVIPENVEWCNRFIAPNWHGTAEFHHFDLYSGEYNPKGSLKAQDFRFPCRDGQADIIFAASVFTHLLEPDCIHYLAEVGRTLSPRGRAILSIHNSVPPGYRFYGTEARIDMASDYFTELASRAGLKEVDRIDDLGGQQAFIFQKSASHSSFE